MKKYARDGRAPVPENEAISRVMSANKAKDTKPEVIFRKALWARGLRGYRTNWKVPGKPDIAFPAKKVAIFVNGCFWHACPKCKLPLPKSNRKFWKDKFERNKVRDKNKTKELQKMGWRVFVVWECEIKKGTLHILEKIKKKIL